MSYVLFIFLPWKRCWAILNWYHSASIIPRYKSDSNSIEWKMCKLSQRRSEIRQRVRILFWCKGARPRSRASVTDIASTSPWLWLGSGRVASKSDRLLYSVLLSLDIPAKKAWLAHHDLVSRSLHRRLGPGEGLARCPVAWGREVQNAGHEILWKLTNIIR